MGLSDDTASLPAAGADRATLHLGDVALCVADAFNRYDPVGVDLLNDDLQAATVTQVHDDRVARLHMANDGAVGSVAGRIVFIMVQPMALAPRAPIKT